MGKRNQKYIQTTLNMGNVSSPLTPKVSGQQNTQNIDTESLNTTQNISKCHFCGVTYKRANYLQKHIAKFH